MRKSFPDPDRNCEWCGDRLLRKVMPNGVRESYTGLSKRRFCNHQCYAQWKISLGDGKRWTKKERAPRLPDPEKYCQHCGVRLIRKRRASGLLEGLRFFKERLFCGRLCFIKYNMSLHDLGGSRERSTCRFKARRRKPDGCCERCGGVGEEVHHIDRNEFNNKVENLERLCVSCHRKEHGIPLQRAGCLICGGFRRRAGKRGLCDKHYRRLKRWGDPLMVMRNGLVVKEDVSSTQ